MKLTSIVLFLSLFTSCADDSEFRSGSSRVSQQSSDSEEPGFSENLEADDNVESVAPEQNQCVEGKGGRIFVSHDEWVFSNTGFEKAPAAKQFALNLVNWLTKCGRESNHKFHAFSNDFSLNESDLNSIFSQKNYSYSSGVSGFDFSVKTL